MKKLLLVAAVVLTWIAGVAHARDKLPVEFNELPISIQREVTGTRVACREQAVGGGGEPSWPMAGITAFYLDNTPAILVDDRNVCDGYYKGGNCHTWGCDVRVYRHSAKGWDKILDEPVSVFILNVDNENNTFNHAIFGFPGKYTDKCGPQWKNCEYIVSWKNGKWHWQKLGGAR